MPTWSSAGYDLDRSDRGLYRFLDPDGLHGLGFDRVCQAVKLGVVLDPSRFDEGLSQVRTNKRYSRPKLGCVATRVLPNATHAEAEHIQAATRHWLCNACGFEHAGLVHSRIVPEPAPSDWETLLDEAADAAGSFGR